MDADYQFLAPGVSAFSTQITWQECQTTIGWNRIRIFLKD